MGIKKIKKNVNVIHAICVFARCNKTHNLIVAVFITFSKTYNNYKESSDGRSTPTRYLETHTGFSSIESPISRRSALENIGSCRCHPGFTVLSVYPQFLNIKEIYNDRQQGKVSSPKIWASYSVIIDAAIVTGLVII